MLVPIAGRNGRGEGLGKTDDQRKDEEITRIVLRPLASPLPLAFFAFGVGSILQSAFQFGVIPQDESRSLAIILGGIIFPSMLLAAIFAFLSRETLEQCAIWLSHHLYRGRDLIVGGWLTTAVNTAERNVEIAQPFRSTL